MSGVYTQVIKAILPAAAELCRDSHNMQAVYLFGGLLTAFVLNNGSYACNVSAVPPPSSSLSLSMQCHYCVCLIDVSQTHEYILQ
jgi:hypothetical protein